MADDLYELQNQALAQALQSSRCSLTSIALGYWPDLKQSGKGIVLNKCPYCDGKQTFGVWEHGKWWGCRKDSCEAHISNIKARKCGNAIGLMMWYENIKFPEAKEKMCQLAGVHYPTYEDWKKHSSTATTKQARKAAKKDARKAAKKTPESPAVKIPDIGRNPWEEVFVRLTLRDQDREKIKRERGLSDEDITFNAYRSSLKMNSEILKEVIDLFPEDELLETGIIVRDNDTKEIKINAQLRGYGLKGKNEDGDSFGITEPILIPYISHEGRITYIRPHKGGISPKSYLEQEKVAGTFYYSECATHTYGEHLLSKIYEEGSKKWHGSCVATEGEWKVAALARTGIPAVSIPGIQMLRNPAFKKEFIQSLDRFEIRNVRVIFDNDDKSHKEDPWNQYDVEVYSRYSAHALKMRGFNTYFGNLPDSWRVDGTADWDGRLSQLITELGDSEGLKRAKKDFKKAYFSCYRYDAQDRLWDGQSEKERIINCKLKKLTYTPEVKVGDEQFKKKRDIIIKCDPVFGDVIGVKQLLHNMKECINCYYELKPPTKEDRKSLTTTKEEIEEQKDQAKTLRERAQLEAALVATNMLLNEGMPEPASNFTISCDYRIITKDGNTERLFTFKNNLNQSSTYCQPQAKDLSTPKAFREFCMNNGGFSWLAGEKTLQKLIKDLDVQSAWREIIELDTIGLDLQSGLYILGDCAFGPEPWEVLFPDEEGIIWHRGTGYRLNPNDLDDFAHKVPPLMFQNLPGEERCKPKQMFKQLNDTRDIEKKEVSQYLEEMMVNMSDTTGSLSGMLIVSAALAYAIAPETIDKYNSQAGIWIHGQMGGGKTETGRQLMALWGFLSSYDIPSLGEGTTNVAVDRLMSQYCSWAMHLDEFREDESNKAKIASLRNAYNRQSKKKGRLDQTKKTNSYTPLTMPIVSGESVTTDAATKSRFVCVIMSDEKRKGTEKEQSDRFKRMQMNSAHYHRIGRWIMLHRKQFADACIKNLQEFLADENVAKRIPSARLRTTYGPAYAVFKSLNSIFDMPAADRILETFYNFTIDYVAKASEEVAKVNFSTKFWDDITSMMQRQDSRMSHVVKVSFCAFPQSQYKPVIVNDPHDGKYPAGTAPCVIISGKAAHDMYAADKRQRGEAPELSYQNLFNQLKEQKAWVRSDPSAKRQGHRMTLIPGEDRLSVWVLRIDLMDEATQQVFQPLIDTMLEPEPEPDDPNGYDSSQEAPYRS